MVVVVVWRRLPVVVAVVPAMVPVSDMDRVQDKLMAAEPVVLRRSVAAAVAVLGVPRVVEPVLRRRYAIYKQILLALVRVDIRTGRVSTMTRRCIRRPVHTVHLVKPNQISSIYILWGVVT